MAAKVNAMSKVWSEAEFAKGVSRRDSCVSDRGSSLLLGEDAPDLIRGPRRWHNLRGLLENKNIHHCDAG